MKPKAPKKKDIKPSAKSGEVMAKEPKRTKRLVTYTDNVTGQVWYEYIWGEERINNSDKDK